MQTTYNKIQALYTSLGYELPSENVMPPDDILLERNILIDAEANEMRFAPDLPNLLGELVDILTLTLGTAAMAGFTANQLVMAMELITEANSKKVLVDGVLTKPEGWKAPDLAPCLFMEKEYPEYYVTPHKPPHEVGYRYLLAQEIMPNISEYFDGRKWRKYENAYRNDELVFAPEPNSIYTPLYRVPANHPITLAQ